MILVDTSVWIENLRNLDTEPVATLRFLFRMRTRLAVADVVLMEVLMGARDDAAAERIRRDLADFEIVEVIGADLAIEAARNYRVMRGLGHTIRSSIDLLIGTFCIAGGHVLLHDDRDFDAMRKYLGLLTL